MPSPLNLAALQAVLDDLLHAALFANVDDQKGVFLPSERPVHRLGVALEPFPGLNDWLAAGRLDALFLHRPWRLADDQRAALQRGGIGVLAYHLAFDERLTTGFNPTLAEALAWNPPTLLGEKEGRPLGMLCSLPAARTFAEVDADLSRQFGLSLDKQPPVPDRPVEKVAVVGAMNDALVRQAAEAGAGLYVTGQWRQPARRAVEETGIGVVAVGHQRSEVWGLHALARLLRARLPEIAVLTPPIH